MANAAGLHGGSGHARRHADFYPTLEAARCLDILFGAVPEVAFSETICEPAAGRGHLAAELRLRGYEVSASDLHAHDAPLVPDIATGARFDIMRLRALPNIDAIVTNLPYNNQARLIEHLLPICARDGVWFATITRLGWAGAVTTRRLTTDHPNFHAMVRIGRMRLIEGTTENPKVDHAWLAWSPSPRKARAPMFMARHPKHELDELAELTADVLERYPGS